MSTRRATESDLAPIFAALKSYAEIYSRNDPHGRDAAAFIDGGRQNIQDAGWLIYEGTSDWFPEGMIQKVAPWLVMNTLVTADECEWMVVGDGVAVQHSLVGAPITHTSLNDGTWLEEYDYDESPSEGEVALDSYDDLVRLFAKKRIFGAPRVH